MVVKILNGGKIRLLSTSVGRRNLSLTVSHTHSCQHCGSLAIHTLLDNLQNIIHELVRGPGSSVHHQTRAEQELVGAEPELRLHLGGSQQLQTLGAQHTQHSNIGPQL